jgi:hypothetical protein
VAQLPPEELVSLVDFRYIRDALTPQEALAILRAAEPGREERIVTLREAGYPAYSTTPGWLGYWIEEPTAPDDMSKLIANTQTLTSQGVKGIVMAPQDTADQLPKLIGLVAACDETTIVLDHLGKPRALDPWRAQLAERAAVRRRARECARRQRGTGLRARQGSRQDAN